MALDIRRVCTERNVTMRRMATEAQVNVSTLSRVSRGLVPELPVLVYAKICHWMGISLDKYIEVGE